MLNKEERMTLPLSPAVMASIADATTIAGSSHRTTGVSAISPRTHATKPSMALRPANVSYFWITACKFTDMRSGLHVERIRGSADQSV